MATTNIALRCPPRTRGEELLPPEINRNHLALVIAVVSAVWMEADAAGRSRNCTGLPTDAHREQVQSGAMNILIVEDNLHMRRMLIEMVRAAFEDSLVLEAADANSAFTLCRDVRPELVLMDVGLPDANGIDLTATIKSLLPESKVVIVTNHRGRVYQDAARTAGAAAYILKDEVHEKLIPTLALTLFQPGDDPKRGEDI